MALNSETNKFEFIANRFKSNIVLNLRAKQKLRKLNIKKCRIEEEIDPDECFPTLHSKFNPINYGEEVTYSIKEKDLSLNEIQKEIGTITELFNYAVQKFGSYPLLGTRKIKNTEILPKKNENDEYATKALGEYSWKSYSEVSLMVSTIKELLIIYGFLNGEKMAFLCDSNPDWYILFFALLENHCIVVTIPPEMSDEELIIIMNQTKCSGIFVDLKQKNRLDRILSNLTHLSLILCTSDCIMPPKSISKPVKDKLFVSNFKNFFDSRNNFDFNSSITVDKVHASTIASIMYLPSNNKNQNGIQLTHKNILAALGGIKLQSFKWRSAPYFSIISFCYIFELVSILTCTYYGGCIGFGTIYTIFNGSPGLDYSCLGDIMMLKPFNLTARAEILEPLLSLILSRISTKPIVEQICFEKVLNISIRYKKFENLPSNIKDYFKNIMKSLIGFDICIGFFGLYPILKKTSSLILLCFEQIHTYLGIEPSCCGLSQIKNAYFAIEGYYPPSSEVKIKLSGGLNNLKKIDSDGNPCGEIIINGNSISKGYYKNKELNSESFKIDENHDLWFKTGYIGKYYKDGTIKIIERIKDFMKSNRTIVSNFCLERFLSLVPIVEGISVKYSDKYIGLISLVIPNKQIILTNIKDVSINSKYKSNIFLMNNWHVNLIVSDILNVYLESRKIILSLPMVYKLYSSFHDSEVEEMLYSLPQVKNPKFQLKTSWTYDIDNIVDN